MPETFVQVRFDQAALRRVEQAVAGIPGAMRQIIPPALNRTATWTRTRMAREVAGQLGGKVGAIRNRIHIDRAGGQKWQATVLLLDAVFPLARFAPPTMTGPSGAFARPAGGVFYSLPSGAAGRLPHGFWARMPGGHAGIFQRARYAKPGRASRRVRRPARQGARVYTSELPIYEATVRLHEAIRFNWLPALRNAAAAQLAREIQSRVRWQIERYMRRGR